MPARAKNSFLVTFPAGNGKPAAVFSFQETDINDRRGLALDIRNAGSQPVRVYADLNGNPWERGYLAVSPGKTGTLYIFARRSKIAASDAEKFSNMRGIPGGKMSAGGRAEPVVAKQVKVFMVMPRQDAHIQVGRLRPFGSSLIPNLAGFYPFIDRYGQYKHKEWAGKLHGDADFKANLVKEETDLAQHPGPQHLDQYGGWAAGPQLKATGHFRTEKCQGKWWLIDPQGRLFWSDGIDSVRSSQTTRVRGREKYFKEPPPDGDHLARNLQTKYGDHWQTAFTAQTLRRLRSWGLNTLGAWSDERVTRQQKMPYTFFFKSGVAGQTNLQTNMLGQNLRAAMTQVRETLNNDPWCIGFFVDNEIHASTDPAWFEAYYRTVAALAKEILPNKLYLGSRLDYHNWPEESEAHREIVRQAAKYCDIVGFNFYKFTVEDMVLPAGIDKPVIIGEFHMGALDRGLFHTGLRGVVDQTQRAEAYRYFMTTALCNPASVGAHWFELYDNPTAGRFDGENFQIGFLDVCDTPYGETIAAAREIGYRLYSIRALSGNSGSGGSKLVP